MIGQEELKKVVGVIKTTVEIAQSMEDYITGRQRLRFVPKVGIYQPIMNGENLR